MASLNISTHVANDDCTRNADQYERFPRYFSVERLRAYSDAVFAILLTFMIIPLSTSVDSFNLEEKLVDSLVEEWHRFVIYAVGYFVILSIWENHVLAYEGVKHIGDVVIVINVIQLLVASMLPFLGALLGNHYEDPLTTVLFSCCLVATALLQILTVLIAYSKKKMIAEGVKKHDVVVELCASEGVLLCLAFMSAAISYLNLKAAWVILSLTLFADTISVMLLTLYKRFYPDIKYNTGGYVAHRLVTRRCDPDRTKDFTDGVFAIVATLIILDLTNATANPTKTGPGSIRQELKNDKQAFFSYFATFITVGMMWYVHYTAFHPMIKVGRFTGLLNKWVLLFVGVLPLGFKLVSKFASNTHNRNENTAVQFNCIIIFNASLCQLLTWISGHWKRHKHLLEGYGHVHICWCLILLLVYPLISLILILIATAPATLDANAMQSIQISIPFLFLLIKFCFEVYMHKIQSVKEENPLPPRTGKTAADPQNQHEEGDGNSSDVTRIDNTNI